MTLSAIKLFISCWTICLLATPFANAQAPQRTLEQLTADTSGLLLLKRLCKEARNKVELLPASPEQARQALLDAQVTTRSAMGAVIFHTGGILIDHGWLRILGSGNKQLSRSLMAWNKGKSYNQPGEQPKFLLIADDAAGGFFAINGGALGSDLGYVYYLAPDTLQWESLGRGYADSLDFCLSGDLNTFYKDTRWKNWITDVQQISGDQAYSFYPYLWSKEGKDVERDSRKPVPVSELYTFIQNFRKQLSAN